VSLEDRRTELVTSGVGQPTRVNERARARAVVVAGMHRSGTSAVARAMSLFGFDLPKDIYPPRYDNPLGYWEPRRVIEAHDAFLEAVDFSFDDVLPLPDGALDSEAARALEARLLEILADDYGDSRHFIVKDPRICRLVPIWLRVLRRFEAEPSFVLVLRNPLEVAASLKARRSAPSGTKSLLLWLRHVLEAERDTRGHPRSFVAYEDLLRDWQTAMRRIAGDLSIVWPRASQAARAELDEFISPRQRHHVFAPEELEARPDVVAWVREAYDVLRVAAMGADVDTRMIDEVRAELSRADVLYGPLIGEYRLALDRAEQARAHGEEERASLEADVERDLAGLREREGALGREAVALRAQVEELQATVARREQELAARGDEVALLAAELEGVRADAAQVDRERAARQEEAVALRARAGELEAELAARDEAAAAQRGEALDLRAWADGLQATLRTREQELADAQARIEELLAELREEGHARAADGEALARARVRTQELAAERDAHAAALEARSRELASVAAGAAELRRALESTETSAARREDELTALRLRVERSEGEVAVRDRALGRFERELDRLGRELRRAAEMRAEADRAGSRERARAARLQAELARTFAASRRDAGRREAASAEAGELRAALAEAEQAAADRRAAVEELTAEVERLREALAANADELAARKAAGAAADRRAATADAEARHLTAELTRARELTDERSREAAVARADAQSAANEIAGARSAIAALTRERDALAHDLREQAAALDGRDAAIAKREAALADRAQEVRELEARVGSLSRRLGEQEARIAQYEAELEEARCPLWRRLIRRGDQPTAAGARSPQGLEIASAAAPCRRGPRAWWRSASQLGSWLQRPSDGGLAFVRSYLFLRRSSLFDGDYYLSRYPDVAEAGLNPLMHYVEHGAIEGREPFASIAPGTARADDPLFEFLSRVRGTRRVPLSTPQAPPSVEPERGRSRGGNGRERGVAAPQLVGAPAARTTDAPWEAARETLLPDDFSDFIVLFEPGRNGSGCVRAALQAHPEICCFERVFDPALRNGGDRAARAASFFGFVERYGSADLGALAPESRHKLFTDYLEYLRCLSDRPRIALGVGDDELALLAGAVPEAGAPFLIDALAPHGINVVHVTSGNGAAVEAHAAGRSRFDALIREKLASYPRYATVGGGDLAVASGDAAGLRLLDSATRLLELREPLVPPPKAAAAPPAPVHEAVEGIAAEAPAVAPVAPTPPKSPGELRPLAEAATTPRQRPARRYATRTHRVHDLASFFTGDAAAAGGKRLRVCLVDTILQTGGAEWFAAQLAAKVNAGLFEFTVVAYNARESALARRLGALGARVFCATTLAGESLSYDEWKESRLFELLDWLSPDIVFFSSQYLCERLPKERLAQLPAVVRISNFHEELETADFSWASAVICCSDEQFAAVSKRNAEKARLIKTGVDTELFRPPGAEEREGLKRRHGLEGKKVVLFVARLSDPLKRTPVFQDVVRRINESRSDVAFLVIGYFESHNRVGGEEEAFRAFAAAEGVRWEEYVPPWEMPSYFQLADVLVSTSDEHEGLSNTVLQALAAGVVPVVTPSGGMDELVDEGATGFVAPAGDAPSIAAAVERALDLDSAGRAQSMANGRRRVESSFDLARAAHAYQRAFLDVHRARPTRIAVTDGAFGVGGAEWLVALLIRNADPRQLEFHLVVQRGGSPLLDWARDHGARIHVAPAGMNYTEWKREGVEAVLKRIRPDVVMPCTVTTWPEHEPFYRLLAISQNASDAGVLTTPQYEQADYVVCVSEDVKNQLDQDYRWKMTVLHNSIDVEMFAPDPQVREATRRHLGIAAESTVVLWCGRMHEPRKRVDVLRGVIERNRDPSVHFLVLGYFREGDGDEASWRHFVADRDDVTWVAGTTPWETSRYYAAADVYLSTSGFSNSDFEGLSLATAQALAAGLPVVTTRSGGQHELVEEGVNGLLVDVGDVDALVAGLREVVGYDEDALAAIREQNRRKAEAGFDIRRHTRTYTRLARLLKANVGPALAADPQLAAPRDFHDADAASEEELRTASSFLRHTWPLVRCAEPGGNGASDRAAQLRSLVYAEGARVLAVARPEELGELADGIEAVYWSPGSDAAVPREVSDHAPYAAAVVSAACEGFGDGASRAAALLAPAGLLLVPRLGPHYGCESEEAPYAAKPIARVLDYLDRSFPLWRSCSRWQSHFVLQRDESALPPDGGAVGRKERG
jgi:glycosyltransferase involved in cell wall biosynthesis